MTPNEKIGMLDKLQKRLSTADPVARRLTMILFKELKEDISYQVPMKPIEVSEDGHKFTCPRCKTKFDSEDTVDDFNGCYICLQKWKKRAKETKEL